VSKRLEMFDTMIAKGSTDPFVHYARAMELRSEGRPEDALAAFEAVAVTFPSYVPTYLIGAQVAESLSKLDAARSLLDRGMRVAQDAGDSKALGEMKSLLGTLDDD
jgi:hypothetical protein